MEKITRENIENDYKKAIRAKYRKEKEGDEYSNFLDISGQASLRDLCWKIFSSNPKTDDLKIYSDFFKFSFDSKEENTSTQYTDKFRKVGTFYKEGKEPAKMSTIELAAILVDFEPRPFNKFRIHNLYRDEIQSDDADNSQIANPEKQPIDSSLILDKFLDKKESERGIEKGIVEERKCDEVKESEKVNEVTIEEPKPKAINLFVNIKEKLFDRFKRKIKVTAIGVAIVLCLGFAAIYEFFPRKGCMQWTGNNYEIVDCDLKAADNNIELSDPNQINLKRIKACDTTSFFKNEKAVVFYARSGDSLECFNQIGYHPERRSLYLKPITNYMIGRYVSNKSCK